MSYSRWSEDCDLYVYEADEGFVIHVSERGGGKSYTLATAKLCADKCEELRAQGALVPDELIEDLLDESYCG